jgi:hypothetical protein
MDTSKLLLTRVANSSYQVQLFSLSFTYCQRILLLFIGEANDALSSQICFKPFNNATVSVQLCFVLFYTVGLFGNFSWFGLQ